MTKIYVYAIATGGGSGRVRGSTRGGDVLACALCEDGTGLASHLSSSVSYAKHDIGLTSDWKHECYTKHCPDGFELEWIDEADLDAHAGYQAAFAKNKEMQAESEAVEEEASV